MNKTLALILGTAALTAAVAIPAWSALNAPSGDLLQPISSLFAEDDSAPLVMAESEGHEDDGGSLGRRQSDEDEGECEEEDGACGPSAAPAPAGSVAPPQNGLFGNGAAAPKVQVK